MVGHCGDTSLPILSFAYFVERLVNSSRQGCIKQPCGASRQYQDDPRSPMTHRFESQKVKYIPAKLDPGILYVSKEFGAAAHLVRVRLRRHREDTAG